MDMLYSCAPFPLKAFSSHQNTPAGYPSMNFKTDQPSGFSKHPAIGTGDPSSGITTIPEARVLATMAVDQAHMTTTLDSLDFGAFPLASSLDLSYPGACPVAGEARLMHLESVVSGPGSEPWPAPFSPRAMKSPRLFDMNISLPNQFQPSVPLDPNWWSKYPAQFLSRQSETL
ncbi:transcriptional regulator family: Fungal Specific TF [Penicillium samsonianum]|uniref:transcriptional regulator family: Fungal Specific TF n=1 Tax=Penicillium samsonianum TaxID=1882272 RepID=UPI0025492AF6|nr:transcriptional regulator family: Fungal Specific TF [Penicillium samsonianum]KAJ6118322.1 transcriptional regulator family: Fungal Specific TF [Penicillium samsonianum]